MQSLQSLSLTSLHPLSSSAVAWYQHTLRQYRTARRTLGAIASVSTGQRVAYAQSKARRHHPGTKCTGIVQFSL
eukprot:2679146-Rhodomonas_salina.1